MSDAVCARIAELLARLVPRGNRSLVPGDLVCLYELPVRRDSREPPTSPQTLQKTQLAHSLGLLLGRILDQHRVRPFGWQREGYCSMVCTSADAMLSIIGYALDSDNRFTPTPAQKSAQLVVAQQITSSGILPKLATALSKLADMVQATEQKNPSYMVAAFELLQVALSLIATWPGTGGVLTSAAASAIVMPAVQLADALVQHTITVPESRAQLSVLALEAAFRLVMYIGSMLMDNRHRGTQLAHQPQGLSVVSSGLASPALQQLVLTIVALATEPNALPAIRSGRLAAAMEGQQDTAEAASGAVHGPSAADKASRAVIADGRSSITTQHGKTSSSSEDTDRLTAQHIELCKQQQLLLLQMLYPALGSSSRWADFAATSAAACSRIHLTLYDLQSVVETAISCFSCFCITPLNGGEGASAAGSSSTPRGQASSPAAAAMRPSSLNVLPQLPVLLLQWAYVAVSTSDADVDTSAVYEVVTALSSVALKCCECQDRLNRSHPAGSEKVNIRDQLPAARITELLLQNLRLLLQQQQAVATRAVTSTPGGTVSPCGSAAAPPAPPATGSDVIIGVSSLHSLSQLMCSLKPVTDTAMWHTVSQELYSMLEWWLRVDSSSNHEEQQQQQCSEARSSSSSSSAAYVALQWTDHFHISWLYSTHQLSRAIWSYHLLVDTCDAWLIPAATMCKADGSITRRFDGVLLPCAAAAAPDSFERQQLLTLLISLIKKSSSTDGLLTLSPTDCSKTGIGCELGGLVRAVRDMLNLCGLSSSSNTPGGPCSSKAGQNSSSTQDTCAATADTTNAGGSSSNSSSNMASAGCNSNERSADKCRAATAAAAAPWMVVAARALINKAERLGCCLEYEPAVPDMSCVVQHLHSILTHRANSAGLCPSNPADAAAAQGFLAKVKPMMSDESLKLFEYTQPFIHWTECVHHIICALETAVLGLTGQQGAGSGSTTVSGLAEAADSSNGSNHVHVAAGEVLSQTQTAPTTAMTVSSVQQLLFGNALQLLQRLPLKLRQLADICDALLPTSYVLRHLEPAEWLQSISEVGLTAEVVEALRTTRSMDAFKLALQLWGVQQFQRQLLEIGQLVCSALPLKYFCNSPMCRNFSKSTEADLVNGKGCVCARCETARYCSRECQAAHWSWHKAICTAIKKQRRSSSRTD